MGTIPSPLLVQGVVAAMHGGAIGGEGWSVDAERRVAEYIYTQKQGRATTSLRPSSLSNMAGEDAIAARICTSRYFQISEPCAKGNCCIAIARCMNA